MFVKLKPVQGYDPAATRMLDKGLYLAGAADGIRWKLLNTQRVPTAHGDRGFSCFWDDRIGQYVAYSGLKEKKTIPGERVDPVTGAPADEVTESIRERSVSIMFSEDLRHWTPDNRRVFAADEIDNLGMPPGSPRMDFYAGHVSKYTEAPDVYLALGAAFYYWKRTTSRIGDAHVPDNLFPATLEVQLLTSRDGLHWSRTPGRRPFVRLGLRGTWWSRMVWPSDHIIRMGDSLWVFFSGYNVAHNKEQDLLPCDGARGRAELRLDGFISADAACTGGELITRPLVFAGGCLQLNMDTSAGGSVRVELQDATGRPVPGFGEAEANEINGNYLRATASWKRCSNVVGLAGKPIRLRFIMRSARLYSFQFVESDC
jgi:hypothetical protein